ncbi:MAG: hypothetical protein WBQ18_02360 [Solirubrobacteraceae bacterium]
MLILSIAEAVLLAVALVYIVALLRSHADILRRLSLLEDGAPARPASGPEPVIGGGEVRAAAPISGITLDGDSVALSFGGGSPVTLLAFMTSGCSSCAPLWSGLQHPGGLEALVDRVVVVTHDTSRESPARVRRLAPAEIEVIMASTAWEDYAVPASPHFVLTDGAGGILGRGSALSWPQLVEMVGEARSDAAEARARTTAQRAARSAETLARAGIGPGHPSLYPSAAGPRDGGER